MCVIHLSHQTRYELNISNFKQNQMNVSIMTVASVTVYESIVQILSKFPKWFDLFRNLHSKQMAEPKSAKGRTT